MTTQHFSKAADNNKGHILAQLRQLLNGGEDNLEIGSGTGQHAVYFASEMSDITWHPSDCDLDHYGLRGMLAKTTLRNVKDPITLDINAWPALHENFDVVYSANCIHVADCETGRNLIKGAALSLKPDGLMALYGPFKYGGNFTTDSNAKFDLFLKETYPGSGIRDFEAVDALANENGMTLENDTAMPANNQFIIWRKSLAQI